MQQHSNLLKTAWPKDYCGQIQKFFVHHPMVYYAETLTMIVDIPKQF